MRIDGQWAVFADGFMRPIIRGELRGGDDSWIEVPFLVDTGADRTVISAGVLSKLRLDPLAAQDTVSGLGGLVDSILVETEIQLTREIAGNVILRGQFAAVTELEALDISVLGRDITGLFAVIVDQPGEVVTLLAQRHRYSIVQV
jgi:predicted aspartyl protease